MLQLTSQSEAFQRAMKWMHFHFCSLYCPALGEIFYYLYNIDTNNMFFFVRCLVHYLRDKTVRYSKIRPYIPLCQMDLCRHEVRYGCQREDSCFYAHSLIELKVWMMQSKQGELLFRSHELSDIKDDGKRYNCWIVLIFFRYHTWRYCSGVTEILEYGCCCSSPGRIYTCVLIEQPMFLWEISHVCLVAIGAPTSLAQIWAS